MTLVVGLPRDERAATALHLGGQLARALGDDLVVCTVVPPPWPPGLGRVDAEYQEYLDRDAEEALARARDLLAPGLSADFVVARARSTSRGLVETAEERGATAIVLGSSDAGMLGRVAFGSVAERLLHTSPVPVVLAPRGFRCQPDAGVSRVTAAFGAAEGDEDLVVAAAGVAVRMGAALRVASFAVRPRTPLTAGIGSRAEDAVLAEWSSEVSQAQQAVLEHVAALPTAPTSTGAVIGRGTEWDAALQDVDWTDGDLLAVGSSAEGPLARVFIGSRSSKIVRHSPVPVVVVPRGAAVALAERAEQA
ncbi:universal stress protein [Pseudonocardia humida]|uniref:Universal stress protein n=1 Tax=Pseudonocardia humida TaxID=2800819 RepID=A0ABT1ABM7_9PSEU|nr:universal stress protein [Pseudonocardia humida]MCO1660445.1 universal stress protein [Pseudonocardia humida]